MNRTRLAALLAAALALAPAANAEDTPKRPRARATPSPAPVIPPCPLPDGHGEIAAEGAVVLDALTGRPIFTKNPDARMFPASTTKILTALLVIEAGNLDQPVLVQPEDTRAEPSKVGLVAGERRPRRELLYGLMLKSANDAAEALARDNAGDVAAFAKKMTLRARQLGATSSQFQNPHGLPDPNHFTTPRDLALIARAAMDQPTFHSLVRAEKHPWTSANGTVELTNHNRLLRLYPGCTGLKTGWTRASQHTLVSAALRSHREVIAVVLKTDRRNVWQDSIRLLDYGLGNLPAPPLDPSPPLASKHAAQPD